MENTTLISEMKNQITGHGQLILPPPVVVSPLSQARSKRDLDSG